jgi:hypothetical protein
MLLFENRGITMAEENKCVLNIKDDGNDDHEIEIGFVGKFSIYQTDMSLANALKDTVENLNHLIGKLQKVTVCGALSASDIVPVEINVDNIMLSKHDIDAVLKGTPFTIESEHPEYLESPDQTERSVLSQETLETMSPQELRNHARNIIVNKILTWDCNDVQDLADIVSKEILPIDNALNSNEALDMLIYITPPSAIGVESVNAICPKRDPCHPLPPIWAIDKKLNCYFIGDGTISSLKDELSEK